MSGSPQSVWLVPYGEQEIPKRDYRGLAFWGTMLVLTVVARELDLLWLNWTVWSIYGLFILGMIAFLLTIAFSAEARAQTKATSKAELVAKTLEITLDQDSLQTRILLNGKPEPFSCTVVPLDMIWIMKVNGSSLYAIRKATYQRLIPMDADRFPPGALDDLLTSLESRGVRVTRAVQGGAIGDPAS